MTRKARRNPLDPLAFEGDVSPHRAPGRRYDPHEYVGVHTTTGKDIAVVYAVNKAIASFSLGIVLTLDMTGLEPLPDLDAILASERDFRNVTDPLEDEQVAEAFEAGDADELSDAVEEYLEEDQEWADSKYMRAETWREASYAKVDEENTWNFREVFASLQPEELLEAMQNGNLPLELWMEVVQQRRYKTLVGIDRLLKVEAVSPIRRSLWGHDPDDPDRNDQEYPDQEDDAPQIFTDEDFIDNSWVPEMITIWDSGRTVAEPEYHGTDSVRADKAFPEVEIYNPFGYEQD